MPLLHAKITSLVRKHNHYDSDSERRTQQAKLRQAITDQAGTIFIDFFLTIADVHWDNGITRIRTDDELSKFRRYSKTNPVTIHRHPAFYIRADHHTANSINPKSKLRLTGTLTFIPTTSPFTRLEYGLALYRLETTKPRLEQLGYYASQDLAITINDIQYDAIDSRERKPALKIQPPPPTDRPTKKNRTPPENH